ncbi:uncharacterized protein LOC135421733 [Pseudopipra pipra]|uniref:uncharacterized protein LOC135421733 n=1 Tax=Pseudopipra pipra TaxID=415032 RepID=UPI003138E948
MHIVHKVYIPFTFYSSLLTVAREAEPSPATADPAGAAPSPPGPAAISPSIPAAPALLGPSFPSPFPGPRRTIAPQGRYSAPFVPPAPPALPPPHRCPGPGWCGHSTPTPPHGPAGGAARPGQRRSGRAV